MIRLRRKTQTMQCKDIIKAWFCIEATCGYGWQLLGDDKGILKFSTKIERDSKLAELRKQISSAPQ